MPIIAQTALGGRIILFDSEAADLVVNDTNGVRDVFVRDRGTP